MVIIIFFKSKISVREVFPKTKHAEREEIKLRYHHFQTLKVKTVKSCKLRLS